MLRYRPSYSFRIAGQHNDCQTTTTLPIYPAAEAQGHQFLFFERSLQILSLDNEIHLLELAGFLDTSAHPELRTETRVFSTAALIADTERMGGHNGQRVTIGVSRKIGLEPELDDRNYDV